MKRETYLGINEARPVLGELVNAAQYQGQTTVITRNGKPAARLLPPRTAQPITPTDPATINPMTVLRMLRAHLLPELRESVDRVLEHPRTRATAALTALTATAALTALTAALTTAAARAAEFLPFAALAEELAEDGIGDLPDTLTTEQATYICQIAARHVDIARHRIQSRELAWPDNMPARFAAHGGIGETGIGGGHTALQAIADHHADQRFVEILTGQES